MNKGLKFAFLTACISGFSIFAAKYFITKIDPILFTTLKNLIVALALTIYMLMFSRKSIVSIKKSQWPQLILIGIFGGGIPFILFFSGLSKVSAIEGSIIHKTLFIWVALMSVYVFKEKITLKQIVGYLIVTIGVMFFSKVNFSNLGIGHLMIFIATIMWSIEYLLAKKALKNMSSTTLAWARMSIGVIFLILFSIVNGNINQGINLNLSQMISVLSGSVFLLGYVVTWYYALSQAKASAVSLVLSLSPILTGVFTALFISKSIQIGDLTGWALIIIGVSMSLYYKINKRVSLS